MLHLIDLIDSPIRPIAILFMRVLGETKPSTDTALTAPAQSSLTGEVLNGDAFDLIRKCAAESVDLLITSPPYWGLRTYDLEHNCMIWNITGRLRKIGNEHEVNRPHLPHMIGTARTMVFWGSSQAQIGTLPT